jgi:hypothetical protein
MDPYLESPEVWRGFHHHLAEELVRDLNARLDPKYYAEVEVEAVGEDVRIGAVERRFSDVGIVDTREAGEPAWTVQSRSTLTIPQAPLRRPAVSFAHVKNRSVRVFRTEGGDLVTSMEILSPFNKRPGEGLSEYRRKRDRLLFSQVHLIEIDLLRAGERPGPEVADPPLNADYVILVNRAGSVRESEIWPLSVSDSLPVIPVPLLAPDPDVPVDMGRAVQIVYEASRYAARIDYGKPPLPPLRKDMEAWRQERIRKEVRA